MKNLRVRARGEGVHGKIVVNATSHHKVISVLAFSDRKAIRLLNAVDHVERLRMR